MGGQQLNAYRLIYRVLVIVLKSGLGVCFMLGLAACQSAAPLAPPPTDEPVLVSETGTAAAIQDLSHTLDRGTAKITYRGGDQHPSSGACSNCQFYAHTSFLRTGGLLAAAG